MTIFLNVYPNCVKGFTTKKSAMANIDHQNILFKSVRVVAGKLPTKGITIRDSQGIQVREPA